MRLTVLGCSGSLAGPDSPASGYLLTVPGGQPVVMDFGPGVLGSLQQHADPNEVAVMLSHLHADHCLDLPGLLVWRRYNPIPAIGRGTLIGPPGTAARIGAASSEYPGKIDDISDTFDVSTWTDQEEIELGGMRILARKVNHPPSTFGLRITGPGGEVLAYSGDTGVCDELIELARGADVFLCEASWTHDPENRPPNLHLSGRQAGEAAAKAGVKSLALTHLPPWTWPDDMLAEAREVYDGPIRVVRRDEQIDIG